MLAACSSTKILSLTCTIPSINLITLYCLSVIRTQKRQKGNSDASKNAQNSTKVNQKDESERMKQFHEKLKLEKMPRVEPGMRFIDLVLVDTDPNGELISNSERDPTKYGDWQHNGRVTDF